MENADSNAVAHKKHDLDMRLDDSAIASDGMYS